MGWLHCSVVLNKAQPRASPSGRPGTATRLCPSLHTALFTSAATDKCHSYSKHNQRLNPAGTDTRSLSEPSKSTPSQKEFNQSPEIIKEPDFILPFLSLQCSATDSLAELSEIHQSWGSSWATVHTALVQVAWRVGLAIVLLKTLTLGTAFPSLWSSGTYTAFPQHFTKGIC